MTTNAQQANELDYEALEAFLLDGREVAAGERLRLHPARAQYLEAEGRIAPAGANGAKAAGKTKGKQTAKGA